MLLFSCFILFWIPSKIILRQHDLLKHVKQDNTVIIICHYSVCVIYDLSKAGRSTQLLIIEHQPVNFKLCFLSEEKLFSVIVDLNKTVTAAFTTPRKTKLDGETTMYCFPDYSKFLRYPVQYILRKCLWLYITQVVEKVINHILCFHQFQNVERNCSGKHFLPGETSVFATQYLPVVES